MTFIFGILGGSGLVAGGAARNWPLMIAGVVCALVSWDLARPVDRR